MPGWPSYSSARRAAQKKAPPEGFFFYFAGLGITTEAMASELPKKEGPMGGGHGGGMGGMYF